MDILNEQILRTKELMGILSEQEEQGYKWEGYITHEFGEYHERDGEKTNKIKTLGLKLVDNTGKKITGLAYKVGWNFNPKTTEGTYEKLVSNAEAYLREEIEDNPDIASFINDSTVIPELKDFKIEISAEDLKRPIDDATQKKIDNLVSKGYTVVDKFDLADGDYLEDWSGYNLRIKNSDGTPTGYAGITYSGNKGIQKDKKIKIINGFQKGWDSSDYNAILYKEPK
jgi:hypothetical protein